MYIIVLIGFIGVTKIHPYVIQMYIIILKYLMITHLNSNDILNSIIDTAINPNEP